MSRPPVDYEQEPSTFEGMLAAAIGQTRRAQELGPLPYDECVTMTSAAWLDTLQVIADLRERIGILELDAYEAIENLTDRDGT